MLADTRRTTPSYLEFLGPRSEPGIFLVNTKTAAL